MQESNYGVSVRLMVYNQEEFIRDAMNGIMNQQTDFNVEVVVGDDFSSDKTLDIIRGYKNTDRIHINILQRNQGDDYWKKRQEEGRLYNFRNIIENCSGKYIALLDGDDYWTDPLKLQKQFNLLESDPSLTVACHNLVTLYTESGKLVNRFSDKLKPAERITLQHMLFGNWASTPTIMVRSQIIKTAPLWIFSEKVADYFIWCYAATIGDIGYIDDVMAVYRVHNRGVWGKDSVIKRTLNETANMIRANQKFCGDEKIREENILILRQRLIRNLNEEGLKKDALFKRMEFGFNYLFSGEIRRSGSFLRGKYNL